MKRLVILATVAALLAAPLAAPAAAQSLSILLPALSFPGPAPTISTMDCVPTATMVCPPGR
ncbi:MAG: hypothetical protein NTW20_17285 [Rhodobacterales bacterium]|nr:hypothetical protein [Rhodobacterales bacterium]